MDTHLLYAILGLAPGAVIGLIALSIVLGFRGSGVVNLAQGAVAMYVAYIFHTLKTTGQYVLPIPGLPDGFQVASESGAPTWWALVLAMLTAAGLGLLMHLLVFRPLRHAPVLAKLVGSVGILLVLQSVIAYRFGTTPLAVSSLLPSEGSLNVFDTEIPNDRFILIGISIVVAVLLTALYRLTRFGLNTRAAAGNEKGAALLGVSPDRQAGANWILAAMLAGAAGILIAPLTQLTPTGFTLLVIPALAAALVGRFSSFGITLAAALFIGAAQGVLTNLPTEFDWFPEIGVADALPFILIVIAMFVIGDALPTRGTIREGRLPFAFQPTRAAAITGAIMTAAVVVMLFTMSSGYRVAIITSLIAAVLCLSLVVITGFLGQISLFQYALAGVSAFSVAALTRSYDVPMPLMLLFGGLVACVVGVVAGIPALRVRGINLAVVTLAAGWAIEKFVFSNPDYTGGIQGSSLPPPELFGINLAFSQGRDVGTPAFGLLCLTVFVILAIAVTNVRRSKLGSRMLAVRSNESAAASAGVNVAVTKLVGFAIAAFIAGVGGVLIGFQQATVNASSFGALLSIGIFVTAYLGGISSVAGAVFAGTLATGAWWPYVTESLVFTHASDPVQLQSMLSGVLLIVVAIMNPEGVAGATRLMALKLLGLFKRGGRSDQPEPVRPTAAPAVGLEGQSAAV